MTDGRPKKRRVIHKQPLSFKFSPRGRRGKPGVAMLKLEEYEALRLADYQGRTHMESAKMMDISRQTFERILKDARKTVSDALVNGKSIKIWGGSYGFNDPLPEGQAR